MTMIASRELRVGAIKLPVPLLLPRRGVGSARIPPPTSKRAHLACASSQKWSRRTSRAFCKRARGTHDNAGSVDWLTLRSPCRTPCGLRFDKKKRNIWRFQSWWAGIALVWSIVASAQEMEPRSYSAVPVGTNFAVAGYARSTGDVSLDPSLPITDLQARINTYSLGYSHSFGVAGHLASIAVLLPYANANLTGNVAGVPG